MTNAPTVLVTGGAGYIGSHVVLALRDSGYPVVVLDDLSTGVRQAVPPDVTLIEGDAGDTELTGQVIDHHAVGAILHFAGSLIVPESVRKPLSYYRNNTCVSQSLVEVCVKKDVRHMVFSSTAAVYGSPAFVPVTEETPTAPINPYGASKLMTEWMLRDTAAAHDFTYVSLRYFNVAGADPLGRSGQSTVNATHLLKVACEAALGRRDHVEIFGQDYDTPDGTCIRDYIHVSDLASAHVTALAHLLSGGESIVLNCGYGRGYSVLDVVNRVQQHAAIPVDIRHAPRRAGDAPIVVADASKLRRLLAWEPRFDSLDVIVRTTLDWERRGSWRAEQRLASCR